MKPFAVSVFACLLALPLTAAEPTAKEAALVPELKWIAFPDPRLEVRGLKWFQENKPELWRFPKTAKDVVPKGVWARAVAPDGGRIRLNSNTSKLAVRAQTQSQRKNCFFDAYVDGQYLGSAELTGTNAQDLVLFDKLDRRPKDLTIYLPNNSEVRVLGVGIDASSEPALPSGRFAMDLPLVCYGSSVLQGTGAKHPAKTYPAIAARRLNVDFVNLGFGGAGKAETDVVQLVNQIDACCYLFDLGKSYGDQPAEPYARMLAAIRKSHPKTPIICVTPIYSSREPTEPAYKEKSERLRKMMRDAALERQKAGDKLVFVVEGLELFGPADKDALHDPQHPNDEGNERLAGRLMPVLGKAIFGEMPTAPKTK